MKKTLFFVLYFVVIVVVMLAGVIVSDHVFAVDGPPPKVSREELPSIRADPGGCTPEVHEVLQDAVDEKCKILRRCKHDQSCDALLSNLRKNLDCAKAREILNSTCFDGGDNAHKQALGDARQSAWRCIDIRVKKRCGLCPHSDLDDQKTDVGENP
ncbi:hypothetical protein DJ031_04560 [bacterium endosymbiont of Escarpia laminata]|nr:MAG: hypothetical protein DJ031_04560 [bacterium endosymbiont of Escarpia laminata]